MALDLFFDKEVVGVRIEVGDWSRNWGSGVLGVGGAQKLGAVMLKGMPSIKRRWVGGDDLGPPSVVSAWEHNPQLPTGHSRVWCIGER